MNYSQAGLMKMWPPRGSYDLLYLPYNARQRRTIGYAFINFISHSALLDFHAKWQDFVLEAEAEERGLEIAVADVQGLHKNLLHMKRSKKIGSIKRARHMPVIIRPDGTVADFKRTME